MPACSVVSGSATPGTVAHQAPLSMGSSRLEYWGLSNPGIKPRSFGFAAGFFTTAPAGKPNNNYIDIQMYRKFTK